MSHRGESRNHAPLPRLPVPLANVAHVPLIGAPRPMGPQLAIVPHPGPCYYPLAIDITGKDENGNAVCLKHVWGGVDTRLKIAAQFMAERMRTLDIDDVVEIERTGMLALKCADTLMGLEEATRMAMMAEEATGQAAGEAAATDGPVPQDS